ncbi:RNA polymerase subunit sigma [Flavobacterium album]|uniref:RNA polymerase subunit sigma n=1 Tax=Flavobacterium album TaxID=2175091 RepID=A0A2S1QVV2_9FLAO|nr:sigma-70 family RNA polymerase sigma factor [Flavobacterium album]AWH84547.1 RNA polymerase subunit sigma [Flavobacterium album]
MTTTNQLIPHLFRQEFAKMTAVLCRHFGLLYLETAEDIAGETFLKASEYWAVHGIPDNPVAWLYTVAKNKARDHIRHNTIFRDKVSRELKADGIFEENSFEVDDRIIADSQLAMIFAVCNPANPPESQIALALQILCGFSVEEIADAFLAKAETIKKRLHRARSRLRNDNFRIKDLAGKEVAERMETVLKTLYLLFNEGYFSRSNNRTVRKELCCEAMRLTLVLTQNPLTDSPDSNALLALMCFQSSRLEARMNEEGELILFEDQDRALWDNELIHKGNNFLVNACTGDKISKYHLEAGIAYWHTTAATTDKWKPILQLYNELVIIEYSPVTALNRTFAYAMVHGNEMAITEAEKLNLPESSHYHALLGYLYSDVNADNAARHYKEAIRITKVKAEKQTLQKKLVQLQKG